MLTKLKHHTRALRAAALIAAALALVPVLTGCGGSGSDAEPASATQTASNGDVYNGADVTFAQQMIPHHAQAIEMADMTRGRDLSPEVEQLAVEIMAAQTPEIEAMTDWLAAWGEEVPETMRDHANAHGDGGQDIGQDLPGMMSDEEMDALGSAREAEFENLWLEMMIEHHEGAIGMATAEQRDGEFADAIGMAEAIEDGQADEIAQMQDMLES